MREAMLCLILGTGLMAPFGQVSRAQENSAAVTQALAQGDGFLKAKEFDKALEAYRKADKLSHHACAECDLQMFKVNRQRGDLTAALDDAKRAVKAAGVDKTWAARGHMARGSLLAEMAGKPTDKKLREAEEEMREALALDPTQTLVRFSLGTILIKQERDSEGIEELKVFIAAPGADPRTVGEARRVIASPIRAREPFAPDFSFTTLEGGNISNAALRGKVVLLDFWGTWCPPCRESVPMLLEIRKKYASRPFQMVGISSDDNEQVWKSFIVGHRMDWPEYIDLSGQVQNLFIVNSFPTYIVLDRDGVIRFRQSGLSEISGEELEEAINKSLKRPSDPQVAAVATPPASANAEGGAEMEPTAPATNKKEEAASSRGDDDEYIGGVSQNVYQNEALGLSYEFPKGWVAAKAEDLHAANERVAAALKSNVPNQGSESGASPHVSIPSTIFYASQIGRGDGQSLAPPCVRLTTVPWNVPKLTLETERSIVERMNHPGTQIIRATEGLTVSGQMFFRTDFAATQNSRQFWFSRIDTVAGNYLVTLEIFAMDQDTLGQVAATSRSISFKKP